jgi:pyruvate dehydrogenase E1 component alpha subunit
LKIRLSHGAIIENGDYDLVDPSLVGREISLELFRQMLRLRRMEEALIAEYHPADEMRCPIHFCVGQEAVPAALSLLLKPEDYLFSHHRTHGYYFAKGAPLRELFAEIYGRVTGANGGLAGSQDISHTESRFFGGAILAGAVCIAAGAAFGLQHQKSKGISVAGFGEGATDEGAFWEAVNHAGAKRLPILFVVENNRYATFSDQLKRQQTDNIAERVAPFGIKSQTIFGNDAPLVWKSLGDAVDSVRGGSGPALVEAYTYRLNSHVGPEDDGFNKYRPQREIDFWKRNCPIGLLRQKLEKLGWIDDGEVSRMESEIAAEIAECFAFAKNSPFPSEANWHSRNFSNATPVADALLAEVESTDFNPSQGEAKLAPY